MRKIHSKPTLSPLLTEGLAPPCPVSPALGFLELGNGFPELGNGNPAPLGSPAKMAPRPPQNGASPPVSRPFPPARAQCGAGRSGRGAPRGGGGVASRRRAREDVALSSQSATAPLAGRGRGCGGRRWAEAEGRVGGRSAGRGRDKEGTGGGESQSACRSRRRGRRGVSLIGQQGGSAGGRAAWRLLPVGGAAEEKRVAAAAPGNGEGRAGPGGAGRRPRDRRWASGGWQRPTPLPHPLTAGAGTWQQPGRASGTPGLVAMGTWGA